MNFNVNVHPQRLHIANNRDTCPLRQNRFSQAAVQASEYHSHIRTQKHQVLVTPNDNDT